MTNEKYKRLYILETYLNAVESTIDARMADKVATWATETRNLHPDFEYRIINAETNTMAASSFAGQLIAPTIRYVVHIGYTV